MKLLLPALLFLSILRCSAQDSSKITTFTKVEIESEYPGGTKAWNAFLGKNLHYPMDAISNEIQGTVIVQFVVDAAGNTSDFKAVGGPAKGGLREEAVRVVSISGQWVPATQNGQKVRSYKKVPIVFKIMKQISRLGL